MIVVTTPSGHIGSKLAAKLIADGQPVRILARDPAKLDPAVKAKADIVIGSSDDPAALDTALKGAEALFWVTPPGHVDGRFEPHYVHFAHVLTDAVQRSTLARLVIVSSAGYPAYGAGPIGALHRSEDICAAISIPKAILRCGSFAENFLQYRQQFLAQSAIALPRPVELAIPICTASDVAEVAAQLLTGPAWTGTTYHLIYGFEDLDGRQIAERFSALLGRSVRYQEVFEKTFVEGLLGHGVPSNLIDELCAMHRAIREGLYQREARTPASTTPTTFASWLEQSFL
ncbi:MULTISPECIES: NmrA family NAD(P)-binding protein [unclassified Pseudomonas]|uniref:NmrA family NAD(P)-binding protein n=1 Tax=unclassified Pseudomonas TaxID=196821 RepID=UPI00215C5572|nr:MULTISPECIES: NmrA family NAD(P)-binding protein [unclassified Pseudomonas]MCR8932230.1 NmrA family NAD(P)-binding protein [Pseudomonas sp. S11A4]MCR8975839.1 NmrA family NAD(P)-binding protein [Pseudomonas sp. S11P7]